MMKFGSGVPGVEPPIDGGLGGVALRDRGRDRDFPREGLLAGEPPAEAGGSALSSTSAIACPVLNTEFNQLPCLGV